MKPNYIPIRIAAPVMKGWLIPAILLWLIRRVPLISRMIWAKAGMFSLRGIELEEEATLLPLEPVSSKLLEISKLKPVPSDSSFD
jgi:hypothetical protein